MKKTNILIVVASFLLLGCSKDEENIVDCLGESILMDIHHSAAAQDANTINFTFNYDGDETLDNTIHWDFGDGQQQAATGTTVGHTYTAAGSYTVKGKPTVRSNGGTCSPEIVEHVTIN